MKPIHRILSLIVLFSPVSLLAQGPELSADDPITYTADNGVLIATSNAVYEDEDSRVEADEIRYDRVSNSIEATGNVRVTRAGLRLLTHYLTYDTVTKTVTSGPFRAGYPPVFMEGESFSGTLDSIDFNNVTMYFREPVSTSPKLEVENGTWISDESISGKGLKLNALGGLKIPLPAFTYSIGAPQADVDIKLGFRSPLGAYFQSKWLYPYSPRLSAGGNFDAFTNRGIMVGPAFEWSKNDGRIEAFIDTGWIHDGNKEERGVDILGNPIEKDRGFGEFGLRARNEEASLQFQLRGNYMTDSEVIRDFRRDKYFERFQPDHFVDFTWQQDSFLVNLFARRQINDSYGMVERLPEVSAEFLPTELGESKVFIQAQASALKYRRLEVAPPQMSISYPENALGLSDYVFFWDTMYREPLLSESPYHNRLDSSVTLTRPFHGPAGINLILRAGSRWTSYDRDASGIGSSYSDDRLMGELGFDLSQTLSRTYSVTIPRWDMDKVQHLSKWSVQYRYFGADDEDSFDSPILDRYMYHARRPVLDLADIRHSDDLEDWNVARFGWENRLLVAGEDGDFQDYLSLNLFQDVNLDPDYGEDNWDALYAEVDWLPFPWLDVQLRQKYKPESQDLESSFLRTTLRSADLWSLTLQAEYLDSAIEQYELEGRYRLTENLGLIGYWHYDARQSTWIRQQYGISRRMGNVWQLDVYVALYDDNLREDDFSIGMRLLWLSF